MNVAPHAANDEFSVAIVDVLSLRDSDKLDYHAIRAAQFSNISRFGYARLALIVGGALIAAWLMRNTVPMIANIGCFTLILCAALFRTIARRRSMPSIDSVSVAAMRGELIRSATSSLSVAAPFGVIAWAGDGVLLTQVWVVFAAVFAGYGLLTAMAPVMYVGLMPIIALAGAAAFLWVGEPLLALSASVYGAAMTLGVVLAARRHLQLQLVQKAVTERAETVSLLLKEFEDASADWLWQTDSSRKLDRVSPRFAHAMGREPAELQGRPFLELIAGANWQRGKFPPALHELANRLNRREAFSNLMVPVEINGERRWWELSATPRFDDDGRFSGFHGVGSDVTEQQDSADKIAQLARFDALTGLPNRVYVNETLAGALEQAAAWRRRCAFMMIDLDRFKAVNDTLGHPIGDRLLAQVAGRIRELCGKEAIAGRLGGDEFAVVVREVSSIEALESLAHKIIDAVSRPFEIDSHALYVGASIGYAIGPRDGASVETLTRNADLALYRSKEQGGGACNSYEPTLHDQARERRDIEIELRSALKKNEFEVHYQPVVRSDGSVDGFEALLRWKNAKLGNVSPVKFIPVAEDTRLIGPIGSWVLQTACREAVNWPAGTKVAVNVSAEQLADPGFVNSVISALSHSGLHHSRLELEVTESVFMREVAGAAQALEQIRGLGVKLALDDFGTGYSSLGYLRMGQFATIKVDRSFVQSALKGGRESIAIIRAVVALAESLEMTTTAEGIETAEEASAIVSLGCKKLQGYHFGRPMTAADAKAMFQPLAGSRERAA
jgi:diguanylate cyclase (GGDEF)-like protein/PAS domain S-box-containing protein